MAKRATSTKLKLLAISRRLGSIPSLAYALAYLLLIPIFALIYYYLPQHFYHSTIQQEYSMAQDTEVLKQELSRVFFTKFRKENKADIRFGPTDTAYIEEGRFTLGEITSVQIEGDEIAFRFTLTVKGPNPDDKEKRVIPKAKFSYKESVTIENPDIGSPPGGGEIKAVTIQGLSDGVVFADEWSQRQVANILFPVATQNALPVLPVLVVIPTDLTEKIENYANGVKGFASGISGNFVRMLYLSAVTITTLGFGDVVPITTESRVLVSTEAVLGIVLIGLFLNALSFERAHAERIYQLARKHKTRAE